MKDEQFSLINEKLDLMIKALLLNLVRDLDFKDKVISLHNIGMKEVDIARLLGEQKAKVHSVLWRMKKK